MWMATDVGEYFNPEFGFIRSEDDENWCAFPLKSYKVKKLKDTFPSRRSAADALVAFVQSQPRPTLAGQYFKQP